MNEIFRHHVEQLHPKFEALTGMTQVTLATLPKSAEKSGIYLLAEGELNLCVGRSRKIRSRLRMHVGHYAGASFAVKLAREATGKRTSYTTKDSAKELLKDPGFAATVAAAKERIAVWKSATSKRPTPTGKPCSKSTPRSCLTVRRRTTISTRTDERPAFGPAFGRAQPSGNCDAAYSSILRFRAAMNSMLRRRYS